MARLPLSGGAYYARSNIANAQRRVNYYPEKNPPDAYVPVTHYQCPGLKLLAGAPPGNANPVRGLWTASNGNGYCVIGQKVYSISPTFQLTQIGLLQVPATTPTSAVDNGKTVLLVDNSALGYTIDLGTDTFAQVVDPTNTFNGATRVDFLDTFILWNLIGTQNFGCTLSNEVSFDALFFAGKDSWPDPLATLIVNRREILLMGQKKSEIWYDAGGSLFPFAELPGAYVEHGIAAPYSIASIDIDVMWVGQDLQGQGVVFRQRGYETTRISNFGIEFAMQQIVKAGGTITDAVAYTYQQGGHYFYVISFLSGNQTWVYDSSMVDPNFAWHQRAWTDTNGQLNRHRSNCYAFVYGKNVVGDWQNGQLYELDPDHYIDNVNGFAGPMSFICSFPHISQAEAPNGQIVPTDGKKVQLLQFLADLEIGTAPSLPNNLPPSISLRWSKDRGKTFGNAILQSAGELGQYLTEPQWRIEGIGRDIVLELSHSISTPAALNGGWVDARLLLK